MVLSYRPTTDRYSNQQSITLLQKLSYSLPIIPVYLLFGPLAVVHGIYAKHFGLSLSAIATILLVCRLFDAVTDPAIGYYSDYYHAQKSSRKPFVIVGALLLIVSSYFLFVPAEGNVSATYFLACLLGWYFAFTFFEIPHLSWGAELMTDSQSKTTLYGFRTLGINIGLLLFYLVPFLPFFSSRAYTPQTLHWVVLVASALMLPSLWFCYRLTPNGRQASTAIGERQHMRQPYNSVKSLRWEITNNKPLLIFLAAFFSYGVGVGMWFSLQFIFIDVYLGQGEHFALISLIGLCVSTALISFWVKLAHYCGKKITWSLGVLAYILSITLASLLTPDAANLRSLVWVMIWNYAGISVIGILATSLMADIIDYGSWKFGTNRAATYFSLLMFSIKTTAAIGSAFGLGIAGWYGFDATAMSHSPEQVFGLRLGAFWLPVPILLLTLVFIAKIPINSHRHRIIRRRLDARAARAHQTISPKYPESLMPNREGIAVKD